MAHYLVLAGERFPDITAPVTQQVKPVCQKQFWQRLTKEWATLRSLGKTEFHLVRKQYRMRISTIRSRSTIKVTILQNLILTSIILITASTSLAQWNLKGGTLSADSQGWAWHPTIATDASNNIYACWSQHTNPAQQTRGVYDLVGIYCKKWNGSSWSAMGSRIGHNRGDFSASLPEAYHPSLAILGGVPYLAWYEGGGYGWGNNNYNSVFVAHWNGSSWVYDPGSSSNGSVNPSSTSDTRNQAHDPNLAVISGVVHVAYFDGRGLNVQKLSGGVWSTVGNPIDGYYAAKLADVGGVPHIVTTNPSSVKVYKFVSGSWSQVGSDLRTNSNNYANFVDITVLGSTPYVAWQEKTLAGNYKIYVSHFNGSAWVIDNSSNSINIDTSAEAGKPALTNDGRNVYVAWAESAVGVKPLLYVKSSANWSSASTALNVSTTNGSAAGPAMAFTKVPQVIWDERDAVSYTRQVYVRGFGDTGATNTDTLTRWGSDGAAPMLPANTWVYLNPGGLAAGVGIGDESFSTLTFDPVTGKSYLYGKYHAGVSVSSGEDQNALMAYDFLHNRWDLIEISEARFNEQFNGIGHDEGGAAMISNGIYFNHGNLNLSSTSYITYTYDVQAFRGKRMSPAKERPRNDSGRTAYDPEHNVILAVGGQNGHWLYNPATNIWLDVSSSGPAQRQEPGLVYDTKIHKFILHGGGNYNPGQGMTDTWTFDPVNLKWQQIFPANPPPFNGNVWMAYDSINQVSLYLHQWGPEVYTYNGDTNTWIRLQDNPTFNQKDGTSVAGTQLTFDSINRIFLLHHGARLDLIRAFRYSPEKVQSNLVAASSAPLPSSAPASVSGTTVQSNVGPASSAPLPSSAPASVSGLLPGQWTALAAPVFKGIYPALGASKHMTGAYNPDNQRLYFSGGDHAGLGLTPASYSMAYRQETYSFSMTEKLADPGNPEAGFRLEYPYCGPSDKLQPKHPDFVGFTWDSNRHVFWFIPGLLYAGSDVCPGESSTYDDDPPKFYNGGHNFTFNPSTQTWSLAGPSRWGWFGGSGTQEAWGAVHDPVKDQIITFSPGGNATIFNPKTNTWRSVPSVDFLWHDQLKAVDWARRKIYVIQGHTGQLYSFDLDKETTTYLSTAPVPQDQLQYFDQPPTIYDPINNIVLWFRFPYVYGSFWAYHLDTGTWEALPYKAGNIPDLLVTARTAVYDPSIQAVVAFGNGNVDWPEANAASNYIFIFNYDKRSTNLITTSPPTPSVSSTLKAVYLGVTGEDKVGQINQTTPNGKPDFHISVSGLRGAPIRVTISSDSGGVWETPFNGRNWIIATQYDSQGNGHFWFEQFSSKTFHVRVTYPDNSSDEADALNQTATPSVSTGSPSSSPASTLKAVFLGVTGEDKVGQINQTTPNGKPDFHISVSALRSTPQKITITSDTGGIWETPFNGRNWIIAVQHDQAGNGDYWFEQFGSKTFHVKVYYSDGTSDEADALNQSSSFPAIGIPPAATSFPSTLIAVFAGVDRDTVGQTSVSPDGQLDSRIRLTGLRSSPTTVSVTSDTARVWNFPYDGSTWPIGVSNYSAGSADLFLAQWPSNKYHVYVGYTDGTSDEADVTFASTLKATFAGTASDVVGKTSLTADGQNDFQLKLSGLRSRPNKVQLTSDSGGMWNFPYDGSHWVTGIYNYAAGTADTYFSQFVSKQIHVVVGYSDGTSDETDAVILSVPNNTTTPATTTFNTASTSAFTALGSAGPVSIGTRSNEVTITLQDGLNGYSRTEDTHLYQYHHWLNFGFEKDLKFGEWGDYSFLVRYAIFQSEGGPVPDGATIKSAVLSFYKYSPYDYTFRAHRLLKDWRENTATWDTAKATTPWSAAGAFGNDTDILSVADGIGAVGWEPGWLAIDITSGLQAMTAGAPNFGWHIVGTGGNDNLIRFFSREYEIDPTLRPKLTIVYTTPVNTAKQNIVAQTSMTTTSQTSNSTATETNSSLPLANVSSPGELTVVLQEGLAGYNGTQDTHLYRYHHWLNFGSENDLKFGEWGEYSFLVRYAIFQSEGGPIPDGATIKSAVLSFYKHSPYDYTFSAHRLLKDWRETAASWDNATETTRWSIGGAFGNDTDMVATADGQGAVGWDPGWLAIDITSGLQAMSGGARNFGWHIVGTGGNDNLIRFFSRESTIELTLRPKLRIIYYNDTLTTATTNR